MILPSREKLGRWVRDKIIDQCLVSSTHRQGYARAINAWYYNGSGDGTTAIYNKIIVHCDKLASALMSPANLMFRAECENDYGKEMLDRLAVTSRYMTREIANRNLDLEFQEGVEACLPHATVITKCLWGHGGIDARVLMPWQFGVYNESETRLDYQEAFLERTFLTEEQLWRHISHRSDARDLFKRARQHVRGGRSDDVLPGLIHDVALAGTQPYIQSPGDAVQPGGLINMSVAPLAALLPAEVGEGLIEAFEVWIVNDETGDYTTVQIVAPDIVITPRSIRKNLFIPHEHPYGVVQANPTPGYFWGRSELADLIKLQAMTRDRINDIKKIMSLQYDKIRAFVGFSGMNDERFDAMLETGWIAEENQGAKVDDLTPSLPTNAFEELKMLLQFFDDIAGYDNVMSGKGEPNIRSGNHFQGALRQASPRLRDRAIRVERQLQTFGEKLMWLAAEKDPRAHWTKSEDPGRTTDFALAMLPDDTRLLVDSHTSSPAFEQDHANLAGFLFKAGAIDGEDLIDMLPVPNRDMLKEKLRAREISKRQLLQSLPPEALAKTLQGGGGSHARK